MRAAIWGPTHKQADVQLGHVPVRPKAWTAGRISERGFLSDSGCGDGMGNKQRDERSLKRDLLALALLGAVAFLGASLWSYDPADPPSRLVWPENATTANFCGRSGGWAARWLFEGLGLGAWYLLVSLAVLDAALLARRPVGQPVLRLAGWLMSLIGVCTAAALARLAAGPVPLIGPGGYLGALTKSLLLQHFAQVGAWIVAGSLILAGLFMCTDYLILWALAWLVGIPIRGWAGHGARTAKGDAKVRRRSDLDSPTLEPIGQNVAKGKDSGRSIRVTSRAAPDAKGPGISAGSAPPAAGGPGSGSLPAGTAPAPAALPPLRIRKPRKSDREEVVAEIEAAAAAPPDDYELPSLDLLLPGEPVPFEAQEQDVLRKAKILEKTFADFGFHIRVVEIQTGPVIAQFEVELEAGLRLSKITGLADDLAIALRVPSVRIVAPIPGKNTVGIEVPNAERQLVRMREVIEETADKARTMRIPVFLGKDVAGNPMVVDLATLPHLLIAGRTGTGKSVCLNSIIVSILMTRRPDEVRTLLIDPKMVELSPYKNIPHLMHPVVTDMRKAEAILGWAVEKMEERYQLLARAGVRHIGVYNQLGEEELRERIQPVDDEEWAQIPTHMPYIVIVADEMADLMMTAAKEVEGHIIRLAQKSRAVGIHLVLATQKPTVDVITGLIKSNLPARICFQVASRVDSRVVLDEMGADKLLGNGDMLFLWPGTSTLLRGQGTYLSDDEITRVIAAVATSEPQYVKELVQLQVREPVAEARTNAFGHKDELYEAAVDLVVREGRGSCSLLQRALGIGYGRAARLIDYMAEDGIVGPYNGSQAREVLITLDQWDRMRGRTAEAPLSPAPVARRSNRIVVPPGAPASDWGEGSTSSSPLEPLPAPASQGLAPPGPSQTGVSPGAGQSGP